MQEYLLFTVICRYWHEDTAAQSSHYFHSYAVRDRIDLTDYNDISPPRPVQWTMTDYVAVAKKVLPTTVEEKALSENFVQLVARVIIQQIPYFQQFENVLPTFITHKYSEEMSRNSEMVR